MAVYFKSKDSAKILLIGGQGSMTGVDGGGVGPFPRYSISREELTTGDGTYINSKFTININGTAVLKSDQQQRVTQSGERQERVQGESIIKLQFNRNKWPMTGVGKLAIEAYGGGNFSDIVFNDARLVSLEIPEQNESAGVQNLEYSFTFEAYDDDSTTTNDGLLADVDPTYCLSTVSENWEVSPSEQVQGTSSTPTKTFNITHTVSATGLRKFKTSTGAAAYEKGSWQEAKSWCDNRVSDSPPDTITTDLVGNTMPTFDPQLGYTLTKYYNHIRTVSSDIGEGSYSITDTWIASNSAKKATLDLEISAENSQEAPVDTVTVTGTITGLDTDTATSSTSSKYTNAKTELATVESAVFSLAQAAYNGGGILSSTEISKSVSHNQTTGVITLSITYNDLVTTITGAISEELTVSYSGQDDVFAIIGVIGRADGPIIQDMATKTEEKESVSFDIVMGKDNRDSKPNGETTAIAAIKTGGLVESKTESWNKNTGAYNISITKVYG